MRPSSRRLLDFDVECVAAGYADPEFVPHTVTAYAFSWGGEVVVDALPVKWFYDEKRQARFLKPLLDAIDEAGVLTGHNIVRFDLPVLKAAAMYLGLPVMRPTLVQDTIQIRRAKGFKKGQDNIGVLLNVPIDKLPLNHQQWRRAYAEPDLATVRERVSMDVRQHMLIRRAMLDRGWLSAPKPWHP